jgi:probable blue pigment (indigoidine) exporter
MLAGVQRIGADGASVTAMLEPILAGAIAWVALDQVLSAEQILGGAIVLAAVTAAQVSRARAASP